MIHKSLISHDDMISYTEIFYKNIVLLLRCFNVQPTSIIWFSNITIK